MVDERFENIKKAFLVNFEDCTVFNATTDIEVQFKDENDSKWFYENICYPKNLKEDDYPIDLILQGSAIGDSDHIYKSGYIFKFIVRDIDKLIDMINKHSMKIWEEI